MRKVTGKIVSCGNSFKVPRYISSYEEIVFETNQIEPFNVATNEDYTNADVKKAVFRNAGERYQIDHNHGNRIRVTSELVLDNNVAIDINVLS